MTVIPSIVSPHYLASRAGLSILQTGGNAVEAVVATMAVLAVVYPHMCSPGGDAFWLIWNENTGELRALNASGRAAEKATRDFYLSRGLSSIPPRGYLAANTVPGAVSGWQSACDYAAAEMNHQFGWAELFADAIKLAENGVPVSSSLSSWLSKNLSARDLELRYLQRFPEFARIFLKPDGCAYQTCDLLKQPDLAQTFRILASSGAEAFYDGPIARKIVEHLQAHGGLLSLSDFARHRSDWVQPISVNYREFQSFNLPPNTQGFASLEILNILNNFDLPAFGEGTADYYHLLVEATRQAFADRDKYLSDPAFTEIPLPYLLSEQHAARLAARIDIQKAGAEIEPLTPSGDTVWVGAVDKYGNAVSAIQSIFYDFGSAVVAPGTGILLQNRGCAFSLVEGAANQIAPGKRTAHTLNPAMLFRDGRPYLLYGTMGGDGQPQTQAALVTRVVDFGMEPQAAVDAPRWLYGRAWGDKSNDLKLEGRIEESVVRELSRRGHAVKQVEDYTDIMGHAGLILIDRKRGLSIAAVDPRSDGEDPDPGKAASACT